VELNHPPELRLFDIEPSCDFSESQLDRRGGGIASTVGQYVGKPQSLTELPGG
jgi:hypothetical protein